MRNLLFLPAVVLVAAMLSTAVAAEPPGEAHGWGHRHGSAFIHELKQLDLSDAQKASIKEIVKNSHAQLKTQFEAFRQEQQAFDAATPGSPEFQTAADKLAQAASSFASARVQQGAAVRTQVFDLLTDAQKAQLLKLQAEHQQRAAAWHASHAAPTSAE